MLYLSKINTKVKTKVVFAAVAIFIFYMFLFENHAEDETIDYSKFYSKKNENITLKIQTKNRKTTHKTAKWIVITSINDPTEQIKQLSKIEDFQLIVVGDKKTPPNWQHGTAIYLSVTNHESLNFKSFSTTPLNSYTRKNLGYLYAIKHGAQFIYDTDDDIELKLNLKQSFNLEKHSYGLVFDCDSPRVINPYALFGQPLIWPRGFPLTEIQKNHYNNYICGKRKTSVVQQGLINGESDVDAIFKLTKTMSHNKIDIRFDDSAPAIQFPREKISPYNSHNTFFHYDAFWSLYLPKTVSSRLADIWRSYWAQRLMWLLGQTISFNGPNAYQLSKSHSYLKHFELEQAMYVETEKLVEFLFTWKCTKPTFYACVIDLSYQMALGNFWSLDEVDSIQNWLQDLTSLGYLEPEIIESNKRSCTLPNYKDTFIELYAVRYTPNFQKSIDLDNYCCGGQLEEVYELLDSIECLKKFCANSFAKLNFEKMFAKKRRPRMNISLLVTFNWKPVATNIELIKHMYARSFRTIIFCGQDITRLLNENRGAFKKFDSFTFIDLNLGSGGASHYYCMTKAIEMNVLTGGFLLMSDDVLLKFWQLNKYDPTKIWYHVKLECTQKLVLDHKWQHWNKHNLNGMISLWNHFEDIKNGSIPVEKEYVEMVTSYLDILAFNSNYSKETTVCSGQFADLFYLPQKYFKRFHYLSSLFRLSDVFLEIAIPSLLAGLEKNTESVKLTSTYMFPKRYYFKLIEYNQTGDFIHPGKIGDYIGTNAGKLFCEKFIQDTIDL